MIFCHHFKFSWFTKYLIFWDSYCSLCYSSKALHAQLPIQFILTCSTTHQFLRILSSWLQKKRIRTSSRWSYLDMSYFLLTVPQRMSQHSTVTQSGFVWSLCQEQLSIKVWKLWVVVILPINHRLSYLYCFQELGFKDESETEALKPRLKQKWRWAKIQGLCSDIKSWLL